MFKFQFFHLTRLFENGWREVTPQVPSPINRSKMSGIRPVPPTDQYIVHIKNTYKKNNTQEPSQLYDFSKFYNVVICCGKTYGMFLTFFFFCQRVVSNRNNFETNTQAKNNKIEKKVQNKNDFMTTLSNKEVNQEPKGYEK